MINTRNNAVGVSLCRNQSRNNVDKMNTYGVVMLMLMLILEDFEVDASAGSRFGGVALGCIGGEPWWGKLLRAATRS